MCPCGFRDYEKSLPNHIELLRRQRNLFVFPEGGISKTGTIGEAKGGITFLAEKMDSPIIPIGIKGIYGMTLLDFLMRKKRIRVTFGSPILQSELKLVVPRDQSLDPGIYKKEAHYVMKKIADML